MNFSRCLGCFFLYILFFLDYSETKLSVAIINVPGMKWKRYLRQNILRDKYGEACLKVAVRKCYKALMAVKKRCCRTNFKCNSKFKSDFNKKAKIGCIEEFDYSRLKKYNASQKNHGKLKGKKKLIVPRETYLDSCIPHMVPQNKKYINKKTLRNDILRAFIERILRSSSERECEKLSREKCRKACNYAKDEVCKIHTCSYRKKRVFKKACKRECKKEYIIRKRSSRSSSDSD